MDAAEDDPLAIDVLRRPRQRQRVPDHVGEILDLGLLVVVSEDERALLALQLEDRGLEVLRALGDGPREPREPGCGLLGGRPGGAVVGLHRRGSPGWGRGDP